MDKKHEEKDISTKERLLKLMDLLKKHTDIDHQLTIQQLIDLFYIETGISVKSKEIRDDLRIFEKSNIFSTTSNQKTNGTEKYYSHQERLFEIHELRLLVDAISSTKFITSSETENLVNKIKNLTSKDLAKQLENRVLLPANSKTGNKKVKYYISDLHNAITSKQKIEFQYEKYNVMKEFQLSNNGDYYQVNPFALVWSNDYYYLIGEYTPKKEIRHYRVDRIQNIRKTNEIFIPNPDFNLTKYIEKLFHMYSGEEKSIEIEFNNTLINVIIDRFGLNADIRPVDNGKFKLTTTAIISEGLIRWILTWGKDAKVLYPQSLINDLKNETEKLYKLYHEPC